MIIIVCRVIWCRILVIVSEIVTGFRVIIPDDVWMSVLQTIINNSDHDPSPGDVVSP